MPLPASIQTLVCMICGWKKAQLPDHPSMPSTRCMNCDGANLHHRPATQKEVFKARLEAFLTELKQEP